MLALVFIITPDHRGYYANNNAGVGGGASVGSDSAGGVGLSECDGDDILLELDRLRAAARPVYLLARHRTFDMDPVEEAFRYF